MKRSRKNIFELFSYQIEVALLSPGLFKDTKTTSKNGLQNVYLEPSAYQIEIILGSSGFIQRHETPLVTNNLDFGFVEKNNYVSIKLFIL